MSRSFISACACVAVFAITAQAWGACPVGVDQRNLVSDGNFGVSPSQIPGQTFVGAIAGELVGIEVAPLLDTISPETLVHLDLYDGGGQLLGTASRTAMGFPPGSGVVPDPLQEDVIGPGYFDLSALGITVAAGAPLSFRVRHSELGVCDAVAHRCIAGRVGAVCTIDRQCDPSMRVGVNDDGYGAGTALVNGAARPEFDLAFKTFVEPPCTDLCGSAPRSGCRAPVGSQRAMILIKDDATDAKDALIWKWIKGETTPKSAFGQPTGTTAYGLCVYDPSGVVSRATVPAGGTCGAKPCWSEKATSFKYKDAFGTNGGIRTMLLKAGLTDGAAKIIVKGKGMEVDMPALSSLASPLTVQLVSSDGECWTSVFGFPPAIRNDGVQFKDRAD